MNQDKPAKEGIIQHLKYLSNRYEELLKLLDEMENPIKQQTLQKPSWTTFLKIRGKKSTNNTHK